MNETPVAESSVLLSTARNLKNSGMEHQPGADNWRLYFSQITNKNPIWCTYCKKQWHTKDMYWKLHDRPSKSNNSHRSWKPNNGQQQKGQGHANFTSSNQKNNENEIQEHGEFKFKKEDIERLKSLFESLEKPPSACSLAFSGKYSTSHVFNVSEATDHIVSPRVLLIRFWW